LLLFMLRLIPKHVRKTRVTFEFCSFPLFCLIRSTPDSVGPAWVPSKKPPANKFIPDPNNPAELKLRKSARGFLSSKQFQNKKGLWDLVSQNSWTNRNLPPLTCSKSNSRQTDPVTFWLCSKMCCQEKRILCTIMKEKNLW